MDSADAGRLVQLPATELLAAMQRGELSAHELMSATVQRIAATNPAVNALVTLADPEHLLAQARAADDQRARGDQLGLLHGLPFAVKDTEPTAGMRTTWGSPVYADHVPASDSPLVAVQRAAGALVVGKSNVPEFAAGSHTFNPVFGPTRNPYDLTRSAGGSSGGAAAALACGMVALADGSDLGGSLRNPAAFCSVVGLRPSIGRVPDTGPARPWAHAVRGPMGRTVSDVALLLGVQSGRPVRLAQPIQPVPGRPLTVAWCPGFGLPYDADVRRVVDETRPLVEGLGWRVVDAEPDLDGAEEAFLVARARLLAAELGPVYSAHRDSLKASLRWNIEVGLALTADDVRAGAAATQRVRSSVAAFMRDVDLLVLPTVQVAPFPVEQEYPPDVAGHPVTTYLDWMRSCSWLSVTGHPAVSLPAGYDTSGLPVGLQLVGRRHGDDALLAAARAVESALPPRRPPELP